MLADVRTTTSSVTDESSRSHQLAEIRQRERFKWFVERLASRVDRHSVSDLTKKLHSEPSWPGQWEKALVMLALKGTIEAIHAIESVDIADASQSFRSLYELCRSEAYQRAS